MAQTIDLMREKISQNIRRFGWMVTAVFGTVDNPSPSFAYTTGLTERGWPELIIFGTPDYVSHDIIKKIIEKDELPTDGMTVEYNGYPIVLREVPSKEACDNFTVQACAYYERLLPVLQIVLSDKDKRMPWEPGCTASSQNAIVDWSQQIKQ